MHVEAVLKYSELNSVLEHSNVNGFVDAGALESSFITHLINIVPRVFG